MKTIPVENEKTHLMRKIARLYYEACLTQEAISRKLRLSRPKVSRLLQEALDTGIVKITISDEPGSYAEIEREIENRFDLMEAVVVGIENPDSPQDLVKDLGSAGANYCQRIVQDGDVIGFTWGTTLAAMVDSLKPEKKNNVRVVQMVGGLGEPTSDSHAIDVVRRASLAFGAGAILLPTPGIVAIAETAKLLRSERFIAQALDEAKKVSVAFVGIGAMTRDSILMRNESILTWAEFSKIINSGAIGHIGLRFFNIQGEIIQSDFEDRVIGVNLNTLSSLPRIVGIAGGKDKVNAILGAIRGHFINTLITDSETAKKLLER